MLSLDDRSPSLVLDSPLPLTLHPAAVYLRSLSVGSRPTMEQSLKAIAVLGIVFVLLFIYFLTAISLIYLKDCMW
jgi:hypothetical protein